LFFKVMISRGSHFGLNCAKNLKINDCSAHSAFTYTYPFK